MQAHGITQELCDGPAGDSAGDDDEGDLFVDPDAEKPPTEGRVHMHSPTL